MSRTIHPDFQVLLDMKSQEVQELYHSLRSVILSIYPEGNEILYHTHALTTVFSTSSRLGDGYCHIPIYTAHLNLGFNYGTLLPDPDHLLQGTGKLIRHIPIVDVVTMNRLSVTTLISEAVAYSIISQKKPSDVQGQLISKIKKL